MFIAVFFFGASNWNNPNIHHIKMAQFYCVHMKQYYTTFKNANESYVRGFEELVKVTKNVPTRIPFI